MLEQALREMKPNKYGLIFAYKEDKIFVDTQVNSAFKRICKDANIRVITGTHKKTNVKGEISYCKCMTSKVNTHMLRHTFATRCIEASIPIEVLQNILGHANIKTTIDTYGDIYDYHKQKELNKYILYMDKTEGVLKKDINNFEKECVFCN